MPRSAGYIRDEKWTKVTFFHSMVHSTWIRRLIWWYSFCLWHKRNNIYSFGTQLVSFLDLGIFFFWMKSDIFLFLYSFLKNISSCVLDHFSKSSEFLKSPSFSCKTLFNSDIAIAILFKITSEISVVGVTLCFSLAAIGHMIRETPTNSWQQRLRASHWIEMHCFWALLISTQVLRLLVI